jgi:predicted nucleotidyltransferase component of viral defense system
MDSSIYYRQVQLLVRVLPFVAKEECFALKGGTAINLFFRDLPRLSVDIDLVYLPLEDRNTALRESGEALTRIAQDMQTAFPDIQAQRPNPAPDGLRMLIEQHSVRIKLELSPVLRGSVFPPETKDVCEAVEASFGYVRMPVMSFQDVYAGKICAALARQHPRDLFDIKFLLENEGIDDNLRKTFLVYLVSNNRPIAELLHPNRKEIRAMYEGEFLNMTKIQVSVEALEETRDQLVQMIQASLTRDEKAFLLSFKNRSPDWSLLGLEGIQNLPAIQWKLLNLDKMPEDKHTKALNMLEQILSVI